MTDDDRVRAGLERRLSAVESLLPRTPRWRAPGEPGRTGRIRVVAGPAVPRTHARGSLAVVAAAVAVLIVGSIWLASLAPARGPGAVPSSSPEPTITPQASGAPDAIRPAIESRLIVPTGADTWTVVDDRPDALELVHLLQDVGDGGFNVRASIYAPEGVYDPVQETRRLALPADLIGWIAAHPDLEAERPKDVAVGGRRARSIDATVTYVPGPRGETAQFIDIGTGPWNLESPSRIRVVVLELAERPLLIVYNARPELFDRGIAKFQQLMAGMEVQAPASR